jgi:hypothetical protein
VRERNSKITKCFALVIFESKIECDATRIIDWPIVSHQSCKVELEDCSQGDHHGAP